MWNSLFYYYRKEHESCEFELYDVVAIDVLISTGDGKVRFKNTMDYYWI